jgi:uncharacterized membrane protein YdjX (TVP38/TMEM64 family)
MGWQEASVAVIVGGAVAFLIRRAVGRRSAKRKPAQTFVPLASVKRAKDRPDADRGCH